MKVCVFADIHGNGAAFRAAYPMLVNEAADCYIFLGDLCGYYFDQSEVFEQMIRLPGLIAILGNHDQVALRIAAGDDVLGIKYRQKYGSSIDALLAQNNQDILAWLAGIPDRYCREDLRLACFHGSPAEPLGGYVYPDTPLDGLPVSSYWTYLLGHTHHPMVRRAGEAVIVNPGSLGQPRNGGWPTYAVVELGSRETYIQEVPYDKTALIREIQKRSESIPYLIDVLQR